MTPEQIAQLPYRPNVGVMLVNKHNLVFVAQRLDSEKSAWQMPQGGIDKGEDPQDAAYRELEEETGVTSGQVTIEAVTSDWITYDLPHDLVPKLWNGRWRGQKQLWYLMRFLGQDADIDIDTKIPEFSSWKWIELSCLVENIVPFKREVYAKLVSEFGVLLSEK